MQGTFKARFLGLKKDIKTLLEYLKNNYPEFMDVIHYEEDYSQLLDNDKTEVLFDPEDQVNISNFSGTIYEELCKIVPQLEMEASITYYLDQNSMERYTSKEGSNIVEQDDGYACSCCGKFISEAEWDDMMMDDDFDYDSDILCEECRCGEEDYDEDFEDEDY